MVLVTELSEGRRAGVAVAEDDDGCESSRRNRLRDQS